MYREGYILSVCFVDIHVTWKVAVTLGPLIEGGCPDIARNKWYTKWLWQCPRECALRILPTYIGEEKMTGVALSTAAGGG